MGNCLYTPDQFVQDHSTLNNRCCSNFILSVSFLSVSFSFFNKTILQFLRKPLKAHSGEMSNAHKFTKGDVCTNCGHPFVRSFINFDILPLVEFVPEPSISDEEAIELIRQPPSERKLRGGPGAGRGDGPGAKRGDGGGRMGGRDREWKESKEGDDIVTPSFLLPVMQCSP